MITVHPYEWMSIDINHHQNVMCNARECGMVGAWICMRSWMNSEARFDEVRSRELEELDR